MVQNSRVSQNPRASKIEFLVIGGSAGSLDVLFKTLPLIDQSSQLAILVVIHRKQDSDSGLARLLGGKSNLPVSEVEDKQEILRGQIYLAPADYHVLIEKDRTFALDFSEKVNYSRPSIDVSFQSAAQAYGSSVAGLLLSGASADGAEGLRALAGAGGITAVQNPEFAEVPYMPEQGLLSTPVDYILDIAAIGDFISALGRG